MLNIILVAMVIFAVFALQTNVLRNAIIFSCVFSLLCSFAYLLYKAPDVAIAEAVIGSTLATILYLVALKKYKIFRIYYTSTASTIFEKNLVLNILKDFGLHIELELDIIYTKKSVTQIIEASSYDIIIEQDEHQISIHGDESNYHYDSLVNYFKENCKLSIKYHYIIAAINGDDLV